MVKTKQRKSKPKKTPPKVGKKGKQADVAQFHAQLDALGLKIIQLTADGNCFFRGLADQLEGNEEEHGKYRGMVVEYIRNNCETFEPFIEDDVPFDDYCQSMEKDGTWAGHMELQAASLVSHSNICIHRYLSPRWYIQNFNQPRARMVHLSYHDNEHYNSVRLKEDPCDGPARPIIIKADADLSAMSGQAKAVSSICKGGAAKDVVDTASIKLIMAGSGCANVEKAKQVLLQVYGDVDAAIEFLVAEQETDEQSAENHSLPHADTCYGEDEDGNSEQHKEVPIKKANRCDLSNNSLKHEASSAQADDKMIPRNKLCPCGSKKKYKACCGAGKGRSSAKFVVNHAVDSRHGRKEMRRGKKGGPAQSMPSCGSDDWQPDLGALRI